MITIEPKENGVKITGEPKSIGKVIYQILTKPSLFFFSQSAEWQEAQEFLFKVNEEREE